MNVIGMIHTKNVVMMQETMDMALSMKMELSLA